MKKILILFLVLCFFSISVSALTGNFDVDLAKPSIDNTIDNLMKNPYEPSLWEKFIWWLKDIFNQITTL